MVQISQKIQNFPRRNTYPPLQLLQTALLVCFVLRGRGEGRGEGGFALFIESVATAAPQSRGGGEVVGEEQRGGYGRGRGGGISK